MRIIGISGSPRPRGNTARLVNWVLDALGELGAETQYFSVANTEIQFCTACEHCMRQGGCRVDDDYPSLLEAILAADGLVLGSPNYAYDMSAQMKALFDRSHSLLYYMRRLSGKYGVGVAVGGHPYRTDYVAKTLARGTWLCGGYTIGQLHAVSIDRDQTELEHEEKVRRRARGLAQKLQAAIDSQRKFPIQDFLRRTLVDRNLRKMVLPKKESYPFLYQYWDERGWL